MPSEPGWYPDPLGGQGARYWDGTQWDGAIQPGQPTGPMVAQEFPEPAPTPTERSRRRPWPLAALGLVVVIAISSAVFVLTRSTGQESKSAPTISSRTTPTPSVPKADQVAAEVQSSMQSKLDTDPDLSPLHLKVVHVDLVNKAGNEYKGIAQVKSSRGTSHDVPIDVTSDGDKTLWEAAPGAFLFAVQEMPTPTPVAPPPAPAPRPVQVPPPSTVENFRICPSGLTGVATDDTSCAFADSVRAAWYSQPGTTVVAYSPVTHQSYLMTCFVNATNVWPGAKRCSGVNAQGTMLVVYID